MKAILPVTSGAAAMESAVSCLTRVYEEYPIDEVYLVYERARMEAEIVSSVAERLVGGGKVHLSSLGEDAYRGGHDKLVGELLEPGLEGGVVTIISPASRRLAAALSIATARALSKHGEAHIDIAHVDFYWGWWSGIAYPYTPRAIEPVTSMLSQGRFFSTGFRNPCGKFQDLEQAAEAPKWMPGASPPLRRCLAELMRRMNLNDNMPNRTLDKSGGGVKMRIDLRYRGHEANIEADYRNVDDVCKAIARLYKVFKADEEMAEVFSWSGCSDLTAYGQGATTVDLRSNQALKEVIVDTNMLYYGIHNLAYMGCRIIVPECVSSEIENRVYEVAKRNRVESPREFMTCLAYLAMRDLMQLGASIYPSPTPPCDTAIPRIDPLLTDSKTIVTGDLRAYNRWSNTPLSKIAKIYLARRDAIIMERRINDVTRVYSSLAHLLTAFRLANQLGIIENIALHLDNKKINIPLKPITTELTLQT